MKKFEEFLEKVHYLKKDYAANQIKLNAASVYTMIMSGAMDSLLSDGETKITLEMRMEAIEMFKKAAKSSAKLPKSRGSGIGMNEIQDEFQRQLWLTSVNPLFNFHVCDFYEDALVTMGFKSTGTTHLRYRKEKTDFSPPTDIFGNFESLLLDKTISIYGNRNVPRKPAIIGMYKGYTTQTFGDNKQFRKLKISDGTTEGEGVVWPIYGTDKDYDNKLDFNMKSVRGKVCLFVGRVSRSKRGFKSFTVDKIVPLS